MSKLEFRGDGGLYKRVDGNKLSAIFTRKRSGDTAKQAADAKSDKAWSASDKATSAKSHAKAGEAHLAAAQAQGRHSASKTREHMEQEG